MAEVTIHAAKTNLSKLIEKACAGEDVVITRGKEPVARLVPITPKRRGRRFGALRGEASVTDAFFEPLPPDELERWE